MMPPEITAGHYFYHRLPANTFDPSLHTMHLYFSSGAARFDLVSKPLAGAYFVFEAFQQVTKDWSPGQYTVHALINDGVKALGQFTDIVTVRPDLSQSGVDPRSHAKKVLDNIELVLENKASKDVRSYTIAGRTLESMPLHDLLHLRDTYKREYLHEIQALKINNGQDVSGHGTKRIRFR